MFFYSLWQLRKLNFFDSVPNACKRHAHFGQEKEEITLSSPGISACAVDFVSQERPRVRFRECLVCQDVSD